MKNYLVKLTLFIGSYEKQAIHIVKAGTERMAGQRAIENECHDTPVWTDSVKDECWDCGEMVYRVYSAEIIDKNDAEILSKYL